MSTISAGTTSTTTLVATGDTAGTLVFKTNDTGGGGTTALTLGTDQSVTFGGAVASPYTGFKNRIINGAMVIDQRNAGASVTINTAALVYTIDRWSMYGKASAGVYTVQQSSSVVPNNFTSSMKITVTTADATLAAGSQYSFRQRIEGYNIADFGFGTSAAKALTLSFKVRSSVTGTFGGAMFNDTGARCMPFSYTISAADTWTDITVAVPAETAGTWLTTNGDGLEVLFTLGCDTAQKGGTASTWGSSFYLAPSGSVNLISTLNATFYITGVQLEKGSAATSFEYRPYGTELMLCQRYYWKAIENTGSVVVLGTGVVTGTTGLRVSIPLPVPMRALPTGTRVGTVYGYDGSNQQTIDGGSFGFSSTITLAGDLSASGGGFTLGRGLVVYAATGTGNNITASAEL